jgi:hypothetical protein
MGVGLKHGAETWVRRESTHSRVGALKFSVLRHKIRPIILKQEIIRFLLEKSITLTVHIQTLKLERQWAKA